jgi:protein O-mannosyl-transferase
MTTRFTQRHVLFLISIVLIAATLVSYEPIRHNGFVSYDDDVYITQNPDITSGLTWQSLVRAFTQPHYFMWHPLTTLSNIMDCQFFGLNPFGHHLTSLLLHTANALLLFWILTNVTGATWASAFVAAVFALHPLQVESVAWAAERKTVLSGLFWLLTIAVYIHYTKRPGTLRYILLFLIYGLCIMTKPVVVTLPFVLLLLDYWPLERLNWGKKPAEKTVPLSHLLAEKAPLLVLSAILSAVTFVAQQSGGAITAFEKLPIDYRVANTFLSYIKYIAKLVWPSGLAMYYPHPNGNFSSAAVIICVLIFVLITVLSVYPGYRRKYIVVGWLWFAGTLVPVIGLIQSGGQAMADRYTYIPLIGLVIIVTWGVCDALAGIRYHKIILSLSAAAILSSLGAVSWRQVGYWHDDIALYKRATEVVPDNGWAFRLLGRALNQQGRFDEAINSYKESLRIDSDQVDLLTVNDLVGILLNQGKYDEVIALYRKTLTEIPDINNDIATAIPDIETSIQPQDAKLSQIIRCYSRAHLNFGVALDRQGNLDEAVKHYAEALRARPDYAITRKNLANAFLRQGKSDQAIEQFEKYLQLEPGSVEIRISLANALLQTSKSDQAVVRIEEAIKLQPDSAAAYYALGNAYRQQGNIQNATEAFNTAARLAEASGDEQFVQQIMEQLREIQKSK